VGRKIQLAWNFIVPVLLTVLIATIIVVTLRVDSKFAKEAVASRRAACVAVFDGNKDTYDYLKSLYDSADPDSANFLDGLLAAYQGNLKTCLVKANAPPKV